MFERLEPVSEDAAIVASEPAQCRRVHPAKVGVEPGRPLVEVVEPRVRAHQSGLHLAARDEDGRRRSVIGPAPTVLGEGPSELREGHHEDAVEEPIPGNVLDEGRDGGRELLEERPVVCRLVGVGVESADAAASELDEEDPDPQLRANEPRAVAEGAGELEVRVAGRDGFPDECAKPQAAGPRLGRCLTEDVAQGVAAPCPGRPGSPGEEQVLRGAGGAGGSLGIAAIR